jgi:hypothetical protein
MIDARADEIEKCLDNGPNVSGTFPDVLTGARGTLVESWTRSRCLKVVGQTSWSFISPLVLGVIMASRPDTMKHFVVHL